MYVALTGATVCLIVFGVKFGGSSFSHGGIAVVDLDKVAAETGKSVEMRDALQQQANFYKQELTVFQNKATAELQAKVKKIKEQGEEAPEQEKLEAAQFQRQASNVLSQAQNKAGTQLNQLQQVQIAKFRAELKPIIQEAAAKHGLSVVIPKNDGLLLAVQPGADITDEVIKAYQSRKPVAAAAPAAAAPAAAPAAPATAQAPARPARAAAKDAESGRQ
jgi:Skp family chaperone for outer membrane proteins